MIEAFVGLIGGGKSFNAVARMAEYIASGGVVCTNIELMVDPWFNHRYSDKLKSFRVPYPVCSEHLHFADDQFFANAHGLRHFLRTKYKWELQPGQIIDLNNDQISGALHEHLPAGTAEKPVLVVIDEAVDFFDTDDRSTANREFLTFLRYSRKLCIDIIMIAQEFTELNKRIRNQVQWVWTFKDLGTERIPVMRIKYPPPYRFNIACAQWSGRRFGEAGEEPVRLQMRWKDQSVFGCYRTEELFREVKVLRDVKTNFSGSGSLKPEGKKMNKWERLALVASLVVSVVSLVKSGGSTVAEAGAAEVDSCKPHKVAKNEEKAVKDMTAEELAALVKLLEPEKEEVQAFAFDSDGGGRIFTDQGEYSVGDWHEGHKIIRVVKDGYLYLDEEGRLTKYKFHMRPKVRPAENDPTSSDKVAQL